MKRKDIENLERCISQIDAVCKEIGVLSKKSPNDAINSFKLKFINKVLAGANSILGKKIPFNDFKSFEDEKLPSNSDVVFMLSQYMEALDLFRSENIYQSYGEWYYKLDDAQLDEEDSEESILTRPPLALRSK